MLIICIITLDISKYLPSDERIGPKLILLFIALSKQQPKHSAEDSVVGWLAAWLVVFMHKRHTDLLYCQVAELVHAATRSVKPATHWLVQSMIIRPGLWPLGV